MIINCRYWQLFFHKNFLEVLLNYVEKFKIKKNLNGFHEFIGSLYTSLHIQY
jgi:hypothetical protein